MTPSDHPKPLLLDVDTGVDDALALLLALRSPELAPRAITTVAGNVPVDRCTCNTRLVLDVAGAEPGILVAQGAGSPLERELVTASAVHGEDGLGQVSPLYPAPVYPLVEQPASQVILETIRAGAEDVTLVATGPMTNLAQAAREGPETFQQVGEIVQMGGAVGVEGNTGGPWAEFNIYVDPEAAAEVLATGVPVRLVPLDVTRRVVLLRKALRERMQHRDSRVFQFVREITVKYFDYQKARNGLEGGYLHDPTAVTAAIDPGLFIWEPVEIEVVCEGEKRGQTRVRPVAAAKACHVVATEVDYRRVLDLFIERVCS